MDARTLQSWWGEKQGLDGSLIGKTPAEVLSQTGWARSVGGSAPYLSIWARGGNSREEMDAAAAKCEIHELPAVRGCTYVVPASDFALALKAGAGDDSEMKVARKLGVTDAEIDKLCAAVVKALKSAVLDPDEIRAATGGASRSLGEEGKKKGLTTTLPLALGQLQMLGEIRRVPVNGRLDQQRYKYTAWPKNPLAGFKLSADEVQREVARKYFAWIGPATMSEFQWFSGLGVKAAQKAVAGLGLVELEAGRWMFPADLDALKSHKPARAPYYRLTSSLDGMALLRRDHKSLLDAADVTREVSGLSDLPNHVIFDRGRIVGLWDFDPETMTIAWMSFVKKDAKLVKAVEEMEEFVRVQLGDARSFSLDSPKSRAPRLAALRQAAS